jgi:NAD(P)H-dependent FMN reductase
MESDSIIKIKIILGSTRRNRFGDKPANWIFEEIKKKKNVLVELLDLRDYPMPFFDEPMGPAMLNENYSDETVKKWAAKIKESDSFIIVTPEYNHGYPAVLKNAIDSIFPEWNNKPVGFVSYGNSGGARSIEQLRQVAIELRMVPIRSAIHLPIEVYMAVMNEKTPVTPELFKPLREGMMGDRVELFMQELIEMTRTLQCAKHLKIN